LGGLTIDSKPLVTGRRSAFRVAGFSDGLRELDFCNTMILEDLNPEFAGAIENQGIGLSTGLF
jgi:hypothetical protein